MMSPLSTLITLCVLLSQFFVKGMSGVDSVEVKSVTEGESVTLHTDITEVKEEDNIKWMFNNTCIAEMYKRYNVSGDGTDRDQRKLDNQTGSLPLTNIRITDSGLYELEIINSSGTFNKRFNVIVYESKGTPCLRVHGLFLAPVVTAVLMLAAVAAVAADVKCCKTNEQTAQENQEAEAMPMNNINNYMEPAMDEVTVERPISNGVAIHNI